MSKIFLPESMYKIDLDMTFEKLWYSYECDLSISGKVTRLNSADGVLEVYLGKNLTGIMPFSEATIYALQTKEGRISPNITELVGKTIQTKISNITNDCIFLSRKNNMEEALETLKKHTQFDCAVITGFSRISAFLDIGAGIIGRCFAQQFSSVKFRNIEDIGLKKGDIIPVKVIEFLDENNWFELSRVSLLPSHYDFYNAGDTVTCKVFESLNDYDGIGYLVLIDSKFKGVVDSYETQLEYGDEIIAYVKKLKDEGLKLLFIEKL